MVKVKTEALKKFMEANGLNQTELARAAGVDVSYISIVLNGKVATVGIKFVTGILKYTGMKFDDFFFMDEVNNKGEEQRE
ncbi:MAG TPA: helix-turn-helix transcriptional regulator [Thermodesulfovibrio thiophilus]|nr:helix-turn-helix transcriptional regulator [Thermodesulfovibrio thiophilus]